VPVESDTNIAGLKVNVKEKTTSLQVDAQQLLVWRPTINLNHDALEDQVNEVFS
jgi:hypothetical protein